MTISSVKGNDTAVVDALTCLSYSMLRRMSNSVAHYLIENSSSSGMDGIDGTGGGMVAIILPRTVDFPIAVLGVLKAGMAYVPLSIANSQEYNRSVLLDSEPVAIISSSDVWDSFPDLQRDINTPIILLDKLDYNTIDDSDINLSEANKPAVLLYTSGTTGMPKAILHSMKSLSFMCECNKAGIDGKVNPGSEFVCVLDFCFIATVPDMFVALMTGGTCRIVPDNIIRDIDSLSALLKEKDVIHIVSVGHVVKALVSRDCGVRYYFSIGSSMPAMKRTVPSDTVVKNVYGMTEFGAGLAYCLNGNETFVPIGKPIPNTKVYLLDERLMPVKKGQIGEIFISSDGLAIEYWHNAALTRECFLDCPFEPGKRMFRTGDYARQLSTGDFIFCGRKDDLVKVNGIRLNTTDIENAALSCNGISNVAVVVNNNGILCLLYCGSASRKDLLCELKSKIPSGMMPGYVARVGSIPVNHNGKIDRNALKTLLSGTPSNTQVLDSVQESVLFAMRKVLGFNSMCLHDDFFDFGGNSLNVVNLISALPQLTLNVKTVYKERTAERIAAAVSYEKVVMAVPNKERIPLSSFQIRVLESQLTNLESIMWNNPIMLRLGSNCDVTRLYHALQTVAGHHPILSCVPDTKTKTLRYSPLSEFPIEIEAFDSGTPVESELKKFIAPFPMSEAPLWRIRILAGKVESYLLLDFHHLIFDGTSFSIFMDNLSKAYCGKSLEKDYFFDCVQLLMADGHANRKSVSLDGWTFLPFTDCRSDNGMNYFTKRYDTRLSKIDVTHAEISSGFSLDVFAIAAAGVALAECTLKNKVAVNWLFDNRTSNKMSHSFSAYIKMFTVFLELEGKSATDILSDVNSQIHTSLSGETCEYVNMDVYSGRDPVLINNLTGINTDNIQFPFDIQQIDYPYCVNEPIEYLDIEIFYQGDILKFNVSCGKNGDIGNGADVFGDKFISILGNYIKY